MSAHKLKSNHDHQLAPYLKTVESNIQTQLDHLRTIALPQIQVVSIGNIFDPFFEGSAEAIRINLSLPKTDNQVFYIFKLAYSFERATDFKLAIDNIREAIDKNEDRHTRITGINGQNLNHRLENYKDVVLYVGTSKSFSSRLKDHIGHGSDDTAALCLKLWPIFREPGAALILEYYDFGKSIEPESLKLFEYYISQDLRPLMGRNRKA